MSSTIPYIDNQFLIDALGGETEMVKLGNSVAMDLEVLLKPCRQFSINCYVCKGSNYEIQIFNYPTPTCYPDIRFVIWNLSTIVEVAETACHNIGEDETWNQSLLRVKNWFHEKVFPAYLESTFS